MTDHIHEAKGGLKMTDDKGEGNGPYNVGNYVGKRPDCYALEDSRDVIIASLANAAGRKAERDRCEKIVSDHAHEFGLVDRDSVLERIRGGQDVDRCMKSLQK